MLSFLLDAYDLVYALIVLFRKRHFGFPVCSYSEYLVAIMASISEGVLSSLEDYVHTTEFATGINHVCIAKKIKFNGRALHELV